MNVPLTESQRRAALLAAEAKALALFQAIEANQLVAPGRTEREVEQDIYALAEERFGVEKHWHRA
jgi:Xaa-Pro dipeptidase